MCPRHVAEAALIRGHEELCGRNGAQSSLPHLERCLAVVVANLFARTAEEENPSAALL